MEQQGFSPPARTKRTFPHWRFNSAPFRPARSRRTRRNAIRTALDALFPWGSDRTGFDGKPSFPGFYASLRALTGGRAKFETMRQWLKGRRGAPNWFVATLRDRLVQRRAEIDSAIAGLDSLPERRGQGYGLRQWQARKRAREIEEQTARERARR